MLAATVPETDLHGALGAVALDLRWSWHAGARALFGRLDPETAQSPNPVRLLRRLGPAGLAARLDADPELAAAARHVVADFAAYDAAPRTWFGDRHGGTLRAVAYFSAEFTVADCLPIFAGGLGAVAGEQLKSASALGVPVVGVGLLYRETSHQWLDADRHQQESYERLDFETLPLRAATDAGGAPVVVEVPVAEHTVRARVWIAKVGRASLVLLDTDLRSNRPHDRTITRQLYGGDAETRIRQELVLGVGGYRALEALGVEPDVLHLNEGHAAFAALERARALMERHGLSFAEVREAAAPGTVFTTHTPVAAGHDYFPPDLARRHLAGLAARMGVDPEELLALGRYDPGRADDSFCPTVLALRWCGRANGVSRLHGHVTRAMWQGLWPGTPEPEVPVEHVTNGVHFQSWISPELDVVFNRELGARWRTTPGDAAMWARIAHVPDVELWEAHRRARHRLVGYARRWLVTQLERRGAPSAEVAAVADRLDPDALTIGFVGRFVAYKRPDLFLHDRERLVRILGDARRPVQILFAGKAHPNDEAGKEILRDVVTFARDAGLAHRLVFLEDFDMAMDRHLVQGVDVWLNTPRRPLEACGIAGMKAGLNGALNLSTLDGWWDEAWRAADPAGPPIGWVIGRSEPYDDPDLQDAEDAVSLYDRLEHEIAPCFYERDRVGLPRRWLASMKASMAGLAPMWSSHRMVQEYTERFYVPEAAAHRTVTAGGAGTARRRAAGLAELRGAWPSVRVRLVRPGGGPQAAPEAPVRVVAELDPGAVDPDRIRVEAWLSPCGPGTTPGDARAHPLIRSGSGRPLRYVGLVRAHLPHVPTTLSVRARPADDDPAGPRARTLVTWSEATA